MAASTTLPADGEAATDGEQMDETLDALGDEIAREILVAGMDRAVTAEELATQCDVSESTIYRRLDRLNDLGLVERCNHLVSGADAKSAYRTLVDGLTVRLDDGGLCVDRDPADPLASAMETVLGAIDLDHVNYDADRNCVDVQFTLKEEQVQTFATLFGQLSRS